MEDIYAILNINKSLLEDFHLLAERSIDHQTELAFNRNMRTLQEIKERLMTDHNIKVPQQSIDEIMMKVIENANVENKDTSIWSIRELRIVSYYLIKLQGNEAAYIYALKILEANWRDMFFNGLSFYCLDSWNMIDPELRTLTCELLTKQLRQYNGLNNKYMAIKNHANLFDEAGPRRLSALLSQKKQDVKNAPAYFSNKLSTISQSYYSDVIINFIESNQITDLDYIESILELHKYDRTKKIVFADLVLRLNKTGNDVMRTQLCKYANRILGDISLSSTWAPFIGATESDAQKLKKAKQLVNLWFSQKIIETFFEVCVQDSNRKDFWLKYVEYVSNFKIVGSTITKKILQSDNRISNIFLPHFIETASYSSQTSALVLSMKDKIIVEFSDSGALYVYKHNHPKAKMITLKKPNISSTADLKITSMSSLIDINDWGYKTYYEEGRMTHQGYWQERLNGWLEKKIISSNNVSISFQETKDNDLFKARPIPKEEYKPTTVHVQKKTVIDTSENKLNPIERHDVYESNIRFHFASKLIANKRCRIVCGFNGYYLNILNSNLFAYLHPLIDGVPPIGSILIKEPKDDIRWQEIVHFTSGKEIPIGYLRKLDNKILYKQKLGQTGIITIKI